MQTIEAHAKINLTLEVLGRRPDGFHEIASIIQTISLHDTLTLEQSDSLTLTCDRKDLETEENLAYRAAMLLRAQTGNADGARISIKKGIPVAAGLGGGSSDAAAALVGLNRLWGLGLDTEELRSLAAQLSSDAPFFIRGGTAIVLGRGERVRALPAADLPWIVLLSPGAKLPNKTASMYSAISQTSYTRGALTRKLEARIRGGGDVPAQFFFNAFDDVARDVLPDMSGHWEAFESLGAREIHLAGSGPTLFAPVAKKEVGTAMQLLLSQRYGWPAFLASAWEPAGGEPWER